MEKRRKTDKKRWNSPLYFGVRDIDFGQVRGEIDHYNKQVFSRVNVISLGVLAMLLVVMAATGETGPISGFFPLVSLFFFIFVALFLLSNKVRKTKNHAAILAYCYATIVTLYALTICLGPIYDTQQLSMTFFVALLVAQMAIADIPVRVAIVSILASIVFVVASYLNKETALFVYDTLNCGTFLLASILVGFEAQRMRLRLFMKLKQTEHERDTDGLTNVWEKNSGEQQVRRALEQRLHAQGAIVIMDIDDFKQVNDEYGHDHGDIVLRRVGAVLNENFRKEDILVRFGGDEFVLYLSEVGNYQEVRECAQRISDMLEKSDLLAGTDQVTCSFGVAFFPDDGDGYDELLRRADKALYLAKNLGKGKVCFYRKEK